MPNVIVATPSNATPIPTSANHAMPTQMKKRAQPAVSNLLLRSCRSINTFIFSKSGRPSGPQHQLRISDISCILRQATRVSESVTNHASPLHRLRLVANLLTCSNSHRSVEPDIQRKLEFELRIRNSNQLHPQNCVA